MQGTSVAVGMAGREIVVCPLFFIQTLGAIGLHMLSFGRTRSSDVLKVLKEKASSFAKEPLNTEVANQCAIDAWSLCDWVFKEFGQRLELQKLDDLQKQMKENCPSLALFQDVANASKHMEVTKYIPKLKEAKKHHGAFSRSAFSSAFDVSALILVAEDGSEIWFDHALKEVICAWDLFFDVNNLREGT